MTKRPRIYLAGEMDGDWRQRVKGVCAGMAISWVEPLSWEEIQRDYGEFMHDNHYGNIDHPRLIGVVTAQTNPIPLADLVRLDSADLVLAYLDGPGRYGTICEIGYAHGKGKEVWTVARPCLFTEQDAQTSLSDDELDLYSSEEDGLCDDIYSPEDTCYWFAESLCDHLDVSSAEYLCRLLRERFKEALDPNRSLCESPIETMLYDAVAGRLPLVPQHCIGPYRVDFALIEEKIVVELDGHDFHKTKEQRTSDAKRERFLQTNGWSVVRFTGTEIYQDVMACFRELHSLRSTLSGQGGAP